MNDNLDDLFSTFHDFEITKVNLKNKVLTLEIRIPWGLLWDDLDYRLTFELYGCNEISCTYDQTKNNIIINRRPLFKRKTKSLITNNPKIIGNLGIEIQSHEFLKPDKFIFNCNSSLDNIYGATLTLNSNNFKITDNKGNDISFDKYIEIGNKWWDSI